MIKHIIWFFYLLVLLVNAAAIAVGAFVYFRVRDALLQRYLVLVSAFTMFVLGNVMLISYANLNLPDLDLSLQIGFVGFASLSALFLMFAVPYFANGLVWPSPPRWLDIAAVLLATIALVCLLLSFRIDPVERNITQKRGFWMYAAIAVFFMAPTYSVILKILNLRGLAGGVHPIVRWSLLLTVCFFPGFILDLALLARVHVMVFTPLFFGTFCILSTRYITHKYRVMQATVPRGLDTGVMEQILVSAEISAREREVIALIAQGHRTRQIADTLFISPHTVKTHVRNIFRKLGIRSRFELLLLTRDDGKTGRTP